MSRQAREDRLGISLEELRHYFPLPRVLDGLFTLLHKLFGISIKENTDSVQVWHDDVKFYQVHDTDGTHIGSFYFDPYSRPQNKSHLQEVITCRSRHLHGNSGVELDNIEIPSMLLEKLIYLDEVLPLISAHKVCRVADASIVIP